MRINRLSFLAGRDEESPALDLEPDRVTLFIGPNNGGKSRALKDLQHSLTPSGHYVPVIFSRVVLSEFTEEELQNKLTRLIRPKLAGEDANPDSVPTEGRGGRQITSMRTLRAGLAPNAAPNLREYAANHFIKHFFVNLDGTGRLGLTNPAPAEPLGRNPSTTIASLFVNDQARMALSAIVHGAFNQYLVIDPTQMPNLSYRLSDKLPVDGIEKLMDQKALDFFEGSMLLQDASDGTRAFVGMLGEVIAGDPDVILIDEPEAFLHPSLAFILGQQISNSTQGGKQVFCSTHSAAFLLGCILSGAPVDVVRLTYRNGLATSRHLSSSRLKSLMMDPLFRSVGAATALFYENAIVVEGDSDRAFYDEINDRALRYGSRGVNHTIFLNAHNKQTAVNIVSPLRGIGIPTAFIFDIDWIKEDGQVWDRYFRAMGAPIGLKESFAAARRSVRMALENADPNYKRRGGVSLLNGSDRQAADAFFDQMEEYGLFTVRSGELESWLAKLSLERSKSKWLAEVFASMGSDPESDTYLKPEAGDVWDFINRIRLWVGNPYRRGML